MELPLKLDDCIRAFDSEQNWFVENERTGYMEPCHDILLNRSGSTSERIMVSTLLDIYHELHGIRCIDTSPLDEVNTPPDMPNATFRAAHLIWPGTVGLGITDALQRLDSKNRRILGMLFE